jgi:protein tyrosine/serine phosphatase
VVLAVVAVVAAVGLYAAAVRENLAPKNFGVVDEGRVYRSGQLTPSAMRMVHDKYHLKTVIDLGSYWHGGAVANPRGEQRNQEVADALHMTRYVLPLEGDGTGNLNQYILALRLMTDPANQPVLVHCGAGSERTGVAMALYENAAHDRPLEEGLKDTTHFRHDPRRNPHVEEVVRTYGAAIVKAFKSGAQLDDPAAGATHLPSPLPVRSPATSRE